MDNSRYDQLVERGVRSDTGCLIWPGATTGGNVKYGVANIGGKTATLHRSVWVHFNGQVPEGLVVSHACETPLCFEVQHLVTETQQENLLRRKNINHPNAAKTQCPRGHDYDVTYRSGKRGCRLCDAVRNKNAVRRR